MTRLLRVKRLLPAVLLALHPAPLFACAACYGKSDSALAAGMNWGILALLVVVVSVLGTIASFFVFLAKRSAAVMAAANPESPALEAKQ